MDSLSAVYLLQVASSLGAPGRASPAWHLLHTATVFGWADRRGTACSQFALQAVGLEMLEAVELFYVQ